MLHVHKEAFSLKVNLHVYLHLATCIKIATCKDYFSIILNTKVDLARNSSSSFKLKILNELCNLLSPVSTGKAT